MSESESLGIAGAARRRPSYSESRIWSHWQWQPGNGYRDQASSSGRPGHGPARMIIAETGPRLQPAVAVLQKPEERPRAAAAAAAAVRTQIMISEAADHPVSVFISRRSAAAAGAAGRE